MSPVLANLIDAAIPLAIGVALLLEQRILRRRAAADPGAAPFDPGRARSRRLMEGAAVALCLFGAFRIARALTAPKPGLREELAEVARQLEPRLPLRLDDASQLVRVIPGERSLTYVVAVSGIRRGQVDLAALRAELEARTAIRCQDPNLRQLHERGVVLVTRYVDGTGAKLIHLVLPPSACGRKDPPELNLADIELTELITGGDLPGSQTHRAAPPAVTP